MKKKRRLKRKVKIVLLTIFVIVLVLVSGVLGLYYYTYKIDLHEQITTNQNYYTFNDFGYIAIGDYDYDKDGIDDTTEFLLGEKEYAKFNPKYKSEYYENGYAPIEKEGVCTDVVWYALNKAGYDLKKMISKDIELTKKDNIYGITDPDPNIDFRRVGNQEIFFQRYAEILDTDYTEMGSFLPGDIITFDDSDHIAMVSDKINKNGVPYLIQNRDETQKEKEEDRLEKTEMKVTGHYRFIYNEKIQKLMDQID